MPIKNLLLFAGCFLFFLAAAAQGSKDLTLTVIDNQGRPLGGVKIRFYEPSLKETKNTVTNASGTAIAHFDSGKEWEIYINEFKSNKVVKIPEEGEGTQSMTTTYDPESARRRSLQTTDRTGLKTIEQAVSRSTPPGPGISTVRVLVTNSAKAPQRQRDVYVLNAATKEYYHTKTDEQGVATFQLPVSRQYDIDVEGYLNASKVDLPAKEHLLITVETEYNPPSVAQTSSNDTVFQNITAPQKASGMSFYTFTIFKEGKPAANENVFLNELKGKSIYKIKTNGAGVAMVMLPFGKKYMVHFNFERDVDVVDLTHAFGDAKGSMQLSYRPDPRLEHPESFIPTPQSLFLIDFGNFLKKQYPKPVPPKKVSLYTRFCGEVNASSKEAVMEIGVSAQGKSAGLPLNVAFVVDVSGSMEGNDRLDGLKTGMMRLLEKMDGGATVSLVTFSDKMTVVFAPQKLGPKRAEFIKVVSGLSAGGGTNMLEAMKKGYQFAEQGFLPKGNNRIIILTDGYDANEPQKLVDAQKPYNGRIECNTVGVGENYNYALLKQLAENGRGMLNFISDRDKFETVFVEQMFSLSEPLATNLLLEVIYNDRIVFKKLYGADPADMKKGGTTFNMLNLYNGNNAVALAKFDLVRPSKDIEQQPVIVRLTYTDADNEQKITIEKTEFLKWTAYTGIPELIAEAETKKLFAIAIMNQSLKSMADMHVAGKDGEAKSVLERTRAQVKQLYPNADDADVEALLASVNTYHTAFVNLEKKKVLTGK